MRRAGVTPRAWIIWVVAAAVAATLGRNPLYAVILLLAGEVVGTLCQQPGLGVRLPMVRLALLVLGFSAFFNALFVHIGETVLFRLPADWPLVGGAITAEAAVYGASNGMALLALLAIFLAFNRALAPSHLARMAPRSFQAVGMVLLIALTYVPETQRHWQRIREAQAIRGHRLRGWRDWRPIVLPLLVGGLERAMTLAEAMAARGFGAAERPARPVLVQVWLLGSLTAVLAGWALQFWIGWPGWVLLGSGVAGLLLLLWALGRGSRHTRYQERRWTTRDTAVTLAALIPLLLMLLPLPGVDQSSLRYTPYPRLHLPPFDPWLGLSLALLALPAFLPAAHDQD
jgi:energy-coupling factor transport system permease protein